MVKTVPIANFGFYVIYSDISARKLAEKTIKKQLQELEAQNAEMERFTYTVSHDLRSPLITIKGFAGFLLNDIQKGHYEHLENDLRRIINAAGKMDDLLRDLLELSRIGRLLNPPTRFSMTQLAMEVVELLAGRLQETGIQITVDPDMPEVIADKARIREVVQNLVENAVKFRGQHNKPVIAIGCQNAPHAPTFFVRDNGIGIEPRYYDSIFGLFNKLDPGCEGTGIGLSLVKRIVELHNGKIWVESAGTGKGSTFYFTIPGEAISK
jgi:light-regulated signal transduction histidine kinase (bacteriophytochrome)